MSTTLQLVKILNVFKAVLKIISDVICDLITTQSFYWNRFRLFPFLCLAFLLRSLISMYGGQQENVVNDESDEQISHGRSSKFYESN